MGKLAKGTIHVGKWDDTKEPKLIVTFEDDEDIRIEQHSDSIISVDPEDVMELIEALSRAINELRS